MRTRRASFVVVAFGSCLVACGLVLGLDRPEGIDRPVAAEAGAADGATDPCAHVAAPPKPDKDDDANLELPPFWLALRATRINEPDAGPAGLDLDGVCTCSTEPGTARDAGPSCIPRAGSAVACDEPGGIDNGIGALFRAFGATGDPNAGLAEDVRLGQRTVLVYVSKYNGLANDLSVTVGFAESDGLYTNACDERLAFRDGGAGTCADGGYCMPAWNGCDRWHVAPGQLALTNVDIVPLRSAKGYVRDHRIVIQGEVDVPFFIGASSLQVTSPTFTATLEEVVGADTAPRRFRMRDALVAGRMPLTEVSKMLWESNFDGYFLCENPIFYKSAMEEVCRRVDTVRSAALDFQPGLACDALSTGIVFDTDVVDIETAPRTPLSGTDNNRCFGTTPPPVAETCPP